jgi:translocation protein SEC63
LTDDDTRKNYEEYGHPDGKQSFTMGVALPKGLVEGNGLLVLSFYAIIFGLGLPYSIVSDHCVYINWGFTHSFSF